MASADTDNLDPLLGDEIERLRQNGFLGQPGRLRDLFDFLAQNQLSGTVASETTIAYEVFGRTDFSVQSDDATVRVYVHRLRKKLKEFYQDNPPPNGYQIKVPKGEYKLALSSPDTKTANEYGLEVKEARPFRIRWALILPVLLAANLFAWLAFMNSKPGPTVTTSPHPIWAAFQNPNRPLRIVVGDYYLFLPEATEYMPDELIRNFSINSAEDLAAAKLRDPDRFGRTENVDLSYLPTSVAYAMAKIVPALSPHGESIRVLRASDVDATTLKNFDVVYIGLLSGMGYLTPPIFKNSGFAIGTSFDELVDIENGDEYTSTEMSGFEKGREYMDYGYFSFLKTDSGNHIAVVAGMRDTGLRGLADAIDELPHSGKYKSEFLGSKYYELLVEVRGEGKENLSENVVTRKPRE